MNTGLRYSMTICLNTNINEYSFSHTHNICTLIQKYI